ncbi:hypothetical protein PAPYR_12635 [Paratrimastix pyriformis]|uniref:Uncharacterized protein n=1 Tax=Paratrimastix pyriformis TaxID=342808 RepID=A0ABQ8U567_9EUKA|nr:hypothetical protein PAPYR_12635 [Paratrimastix pyriformis]
MLLLRRKQWGNDNIMTFILSFLAWIHLPFPCWASCIYRSARIPSEFRPKKRSTITSSSLQRSRAVGRRDHPHKLGVYHPFPRGLLYLLVPDEALTPDWPQSQQQPQSQPAAGPAPRIHGEIVKETFSGGCASSGAPETGHTKRARASFAAARPRPERFLGFPNVDPRLVVAVRTMLRGA